MYLMCENDQHVASATTSSNVTGPMNELYYQIPPTPCAVCSNVISDQYYLLVADRCYHAKCLRCCVCGVILDDQLTCFDRAGLIFCKNDYSRQFLKMCSRCNAVLSPTDMVMRAKEFTFHVQCFNCVVCACKLNPGDFFGLAPNGVLYCQMHYEPLLYGGGVRDGAASPTSGTAGLLTAGGGGGGGFSAKGRPKKRKLSHNTPLSCLMSGSESAGGSMAVSPNASCGSIRSKRMRTSFKHHQLRTMKAYFALNHNPDAKDLKQLAQKTGLTKRVLQVWFQNARAKYRRALQTKHDCVQPNVDGAAASASKDPATKLPSVHDDSGRATRPASDSSNPGDSLSSFVCQDDRLGSCKTELNCSSPGSQSFRCYSANFAATNLHMDDEEDDDDDDMDECSMKSVADCFQNRLL